MPAAKQKAVVGTASLFLGGGVSNRILAISNTQPACSLHTQRITATPPFGLTRDPPQQARIHQADKSWQACRRLKKGSSRFATRDETEPGKNRVLVPGATAIWSRLEADKPGAPASTCLLIGGVPGHGIAEAIIEPARRWGFVGQSCKLQGQHEKGESKQA